MHLFYTPDIQGETLALPEEESRHCVRVLRLDKGDTIHLVDGRGNWYRCEITVPDPRRCEARLLEKQEGHGRRDFHLHVAIAPTYALDATGNIVAAEGDPRATALLGVRGLIVVHTPKATLVCAQEHAQNLKALVATLPPELR